jgi:hypothetical protein
MRTKILVAAAIIISIAMLVAYILIVKLNLDKIPLRGVFVMDTVPQWYAGI